MKNQINIYVFLLASIFLSSTKGMAQLVGTNQVYDRQAIEQVYEIQATNFGWEFSDLFEEVEMFAEKSFIINLGTSFVSDIVLPPDEFLSSQLPALELLIEKNIIKNLGLGLKLGTKWWRADKLNYNYRYYTAGLRLTYHFSVLDKLDPYLGANVTGRGFWIGNGNQNVNEVKVNLGAIIGARYYLTDGLGVFGEFAEDGIGKIHIGLTFKLK